MSAWSEQVFWLVAASIPEKGRRLARVCGSTPLECLENRPQETS